MQNSWQVTLFSYDNEGRVKQKYVFTSCITSGDSTVFTYDYDRQGNVSHVKVYRNGQEIHHWNNFDERGLLKDVSVAQNATQPALVDFDFAYTPTGLVQTKKIKEFSAGSFRETMSYQYHARDWQTDINDVNSTAKPFAAEYLYFDDGNIQSARFYNEASPLEPKYKYDFGYDARKQLTSADYFRDVSGVWQSVGNFDVTGLTYDANGNLLTLNRSQETGASIDNLTYNYSSGNNRLNSVTDAVLTTTEDWDAEDTDFTYDANGNVKTVKEDGVYKFKSIQYDNRNLPVFVEKGDGSEIIYLYSADGQRIFKKVDSNLGEHYIMDGSLNVGVFDENGLLKHWNLVANGLAGRVETGGKLYYLTDHLGSTRTVIDENGLVVESHDYYPFGLQMPGRNYLAASVRTKELFTGKERDDETGWDYIGWRRYWPAGARWLSVDPLAGKYPGWSPYVYALNNPVRLIDIRGLFPSDPVKNPKIRGGNKTQRNKNRFKKIQRTRKDGNKYYHTGTDVLGRKNSDVMSMLAGKVTYVRDTFKADEYKKDSYGNIVIVKSTKDGKNVFNKYTHLNSVAVKEGEKIEEGGKIGTVGKTGNAARLDDSEAHVHIETSEGGNSFDTTKRVDPEKHMETKFDESGNPKKDEEK